MVYWLVVEAQLINALDSGTLILFSLFIMLKQGAKSAT